MNENIETHSEEAVRPASPTQDEKRSRVSNPASPKKRKSTSLPPETVEYLKAWMMSPEHVAHPYPTEQEKAKIMQDTKIELKQLTNWFVNNRKRYWKPRVEARLQKQQSGSVVPTLPQVVSTCSVPNLVEKDRKQQTSENRLISEASSDDESFTTDSSSQGPIMMEEPLFHQEIVKVHVLRHSKSVASLEDVSVLANLPEERVLESFTETIRYPDVKDSRKLQSKRDAEITRVKKQVLKAYLEQPRSPRKRPNVVSDQPTPRSKFRRVSVQLWKDVCKSAPCYDDETLPTLEEATQLFGFSGPAPIATKLS